jgi:NAD(P)-dependent dehydrogenase (short-subunit alcohol dehydrogenase family)
MSVQGKVVIVTGGAKGIGRWVAKSFAKEGARVAIADVAPMDNVVSEIEAIGGDVLPVRTDVGVEDDVRALMDKVYRQYGRIDVLINDAGIVTHFHEGAPRWPRIRDMDLSFFDRVMHTNLGGTFLCTKHVLPYMESLNAGHIINFGQGTLSAERRPGPPNIGTCVYGVSKISIRAFSKFVADEERDFNICVMSMGPGGGSGRETQPRESGPGIPGGGGGIVTDDSPAWARASTRVSPVENVSNRYVLAAEAPMELSGQQVTVRDGALAIVFD